MLCFARSRMRPRDRCGCELCGTALRPCEGRGRTPIDHALSVGQGVPHETLIPDRVRYLRNVTRNGNGSGSSTAVRSTCRDGTFRACDQRLRVPLAPRVRVRVPLAPPVRMGTRTHDTDPASANGNTHTRHQPSPRHTSDQVPSVGITPLRREAETNQPVRWTSSPSGT
jgi:hypothetical protein